MGRIKFQLTRKHSQNKGGDDSVLEDQISNFPDEILASVLSRLPLRDAVRTSILSSRWRRLWTLISFLKFDRLKSYERIRWKQELYNTEKHNFVNWVNEILELHDAGTIEGFKVCYVLDKRSKYDIDEWIKFALSRKVQSLELDLSMWVDIEKAYTFPIELFDKSKGTCLSPRFGNMAHRTLVGLKSLKSLCLKYVQVGDEVVEFLLSNCPVLERLSIRSSLSLVNLKLTGPLCVLKYLEILNCCYIKSIEISDLNLVSFKYHGSKIKLLLENVPSLVDLCVEGSIARSNFGFLSNDFFAKTSFRLKTLTLGTFCSWDCPKLHLLPTLPNLKQLVLKVTALTDVTLLDYASMTKVAPHLQKFVLQISWNSTLPIDNRAVRRTRILCPHQCLKEVKLGGYYGSKSQLELAFYFFDNAVALERIIIDPRDQSPFSKKNRGTRRQRAARSRAKQQLEGKAPAGVKLLIL